MKLFVFVIVCFAGVSAQECIPSVTTVSGNAAATEICSGQLVFEDNFDILDFTKWSQDVNLWGGNNGEFQWYSNDKRNSYTKNGNLHIEPTLTSEIFGEEFLSSGRVSIPENQCSGDGCSKQGTPDNIIHPIRSAKLTTYDHFAFKYGRLEIRAKIPAGDWLWPALWMMPKDSVYGGWPMSGEIDLMESIGNRNFLNSDGENVGVEHVGCAMHFGPSWQFNGYESTLGSKNQSPGFNEDFHIYSLLWTPEYIQFYYDETLVKTVDGVTEAGDGFWARGNFESSGLPNPWEGGELMAPFDQEFFIIMNVAVGGTNGFIYDGHTNVDYPKPWLNDSPRPKADFWEARNLWEPTWRREADDSHMHVDYVRVYAL